MAVWNRLKLMFITLVEVRECQLSAAQLVSRICGKWLTPFCPSCHRSTRAWNGGVTRPNHRKVKKTRPNPIQPNSTNPTCGCFQLTNNFWSDVRRTMSVVKCEIKLFQNYFSLRLLLSEIILHEIISKLFHELGAAHEYIPTCSMSPEIIFEIISELFSGWNNFISVSDMVTCEIKRWNNFEIISK